MRRLRKNRAMSSVTLRMPDDVVEDLKRVAPTLGFAGYQPLIRAYIGNGLLTCLARLEEAPVPRLIASLKRKGVADSLIQQALAETDQSTSRISPSLRDGVVARHLALSQVAAKVIEDCA
jgi:hypothetical protein